MSQQNISILTLTVIASGAVTEHRAIAFNGSQATQAGQKVMGSSVSRAATGEPLAVVTCGTAIIEAGAAITVGQSLICDSQGRAVPTTGSLTVGSGAVAVSSSAANGAILLGGDLPEFVFADALQAASAAGELIEVLLRR
ncbi:DUF2190 family protein [Candidatus Magnetaquicoccus inordinatus]|uniref:DUF2190 family protein n=1 Tax=Candidatus Magnetaquicoccus inordinatus TaxID=2496818 RepID=UPI00102C8893|nr:DUF2190 family protein [Candidatus Magnetaquicoccus inordinatus]